MQKETTYFEATVRIAACRERPRLGRRIVCTEFKGFSDAGTPRPPSLRQTPGRACHPAFAKTAAVGAKSIEARSEVATLRVRKLP